MYGILLWDSDLYGEDSYITRNGMHGIACITGQEIVLLHHCELNASPIIESSSNSATLHVHTNDRQLHQPITCMLFQNDAVTVTTDTTSETKDDRGGGSITVNDSDIHEEEEEKKKNMKMIMQLNNVFTLGCTVRSGSSVAAAELQGFPWWRSDARFRVNHKRNNNDVVVVPPLHNSNQNSSNYSNSDSIGSNEERYRNGYALTSSAVGIASGSYNRPILLQLPQSSIASSSMITIGDESIATVNGTYTNGASLLNSQSSHKLATIRVDVGSIAAAPMRRSKQSRKTCEDEDDNGFVKTSKGMVAQKKSKKRMRLQ